MSVFLFLPSLEERKKITCPTLVLWIVEREEESDKWLWLPMDGHSGAGKGYSVQARPVHVSASVFGHVKVERDDGRPTGSIGMDHG